MRTSDFSRAPRQARAEAMVVVEAAGAGRGWARRARRAAARADGVVWQRGYSLRGAHGAHGARGVVAFLGCHAQARALADSVAKPGEVPVRTRVLVAEAAGYSNGVWRAEGSQMAHIERFTPTSRETGHGVVPPRVADPRATQRGRGHRARRRSTRPAGTVGHPTPGSPVDAEAMFIGATRYRGPHSWLLLAREWYPMIAAMRRLPGFRWYTVYWEAPFTLGTLAFFATRDDLLGFARLPGHRRLMQWITRGTRNGTGGYIRLHVTPEAAAAPGSAPTDPEQEGA